MPRKPGLDALTDVVDDNDVSDGNDVKDIALIAGVTEPGEPDEDRRRMVNAKVNATAPKPWDRFDPDEAPEPHPFSVRLNRYDRALVRQLATWRSKSMQKTTQELIRAGALAAIAQQERAARRRVGR